MKKALLMPISLLALSVSSAVNAEVRINGFANLVAGQTSSDDLMFGFDDNLDFSQDSLFAIQVSGDINEKVSATAQIVARGEDDYEAKFEWAYLTYAATDNLSISAGRLRLPLFRYSASLDVGYSFHWITAPAVVYDVSFNNIDGVRFDYSNYLGDLEYTFQVVGGNFENKGFENTPGNFADISGDNVLIGSVELAYESFKVRSSVGRSTATLTSAGLEPILSQLDQISPDLADTFAFKDDSGEFYSVSFEYDNFDWFINGEYTITDIKESFNSKDTAFYVSAGVRLGKFTPSFTYENMDGNDGVKFLDQVANVPAPFQPAVGAILTGVQQSLFEEFDIMTLGVRYDMDTNIALKADVSKLDDSLDDQSDATLIRFAVNYVF